MRSDLVFAVMLGSANLGWFLAPVAVLYLLNGRSALGSVGSAVVFISLGNIQACALATVPVCVVDPPSAMLLLPVVAAVGWSPLAARCGMLVAAALRIGWPGIAVRVQTEAPQRTP